MKTIVLTTAIALQLLGVAAAAPADAPPRVRLESQLVCLDAGGAEIRFTVSNAGGRTVRIDPDFHLQLEPVRKGGRDAGVILFVFPAPDFAVIQPEASSTFVLLAGEPFDGEPGVDLSGYRALLEAEVWLAGRSQPVRRTFTFPPCPAPES